MIIKSYIRDYEVTIQKQIDFSEVFGNCGGNGLIVVDEFVYALHRDTVFKNTCGLKIFPVEAIEENKTVEIVLEICGRMMDYSAKKNDVIIAVGGGVIQDLCTFAANILYRGIRLILIPTTLLSQTDSCIGSKSSINFSGFKNLLGYFYPPEKVYVSFEFLKTLNILDYRSGLGEIYKINVMAGPHRVEALSKNIDQLLSQDYETLFPFVSHALEFKKALIEKDEFDVADRRILNFGHTFGHAIETASNYSVPHGIGVAMGVVIANEISLKRGYIGSDYYCRLKKIAKSIIPDNLNGYKLDLRMFLEAASKDKKRQGDAFAGVLLENEESLKVFQDIKKEELSEAVSVGL